MTKLTLETAKLMFNSTDESIRQFALDNYPELWKKSLPKTWEELERVSGYFVDKLSAVLNCNDMKSDTFNRNIRRTQEQAKASIAMAQLSQLMYVYNDGWEPNWKDNSDKWVLYFSENEIRRDHYFAIKSFLVFKTREIRDEFLRNFRELIETAKPLL